MTKIYGLLIIYCYRHIIVMVGKASQRKEEKYLVKIFVYIYAAQTYN